MIELCLAYEVMYNITMEISTIGLWLKLEGLYMTKSLSNKLYLKNQRYSISMKEGTPFLHYLNSFNKIIDNLLYLEVKLENHYYFSYLHFWGCMTI